MLKHLMCQRKSPFLYRVHNWHQTRYSFGRLLTLCHTGPLRGRVIDLSIYV